MVVVVENLEDAAPIRPPGSTGDSIPSCEEERHCACFGCGCVGQLEAKYKQSVREDESSPLRPLVLLVGFQDSAKKSSSSATEASKVNVDRLGCFWIVDQGKIFPLRIMHGGEQGPANGLLRLRYEIAGMGAINSAKYDWETM